MTDVRLDAALIYTLNFRMPPKRSRRASRRPVRLDEDEEFRPKHARKNDLSSETESFQAKETTSKQDKNVTDANNTALLQTLVQSVTTMQKQILDLQNSRGQLPGTQPLQIVSQDPVPGTSSQSHEDQMNYLDLENRPSPTVHHSLMPGVHQQQTSNAEDEIQASMDVLPTVVQSATHHITGKGSLQAANIDNTLNTVPQVHVDKDLLLTTRIPLSTLVKQTVRADIWANKFIDLSLLLTTDQQPSYDLICEPGDFEGMGGPQLKCSQRKSVAIKYINQWTDAFNTYIAVYTEHFPEHTTNLMKYMATVRRIAKKKGDFLMYDT